jgi:hypothetical protein
MMSLDEFRDLRRGQFSLLAGCAWIFIIPTVPLIWYLFPFPQWLSVTLYIISALCLLIAMIRFRSKHPHGFYNSEAEMRLAYTHYCQRRRDLAGLALFIAVIIVLGMILHKLAEREKENRAFAAADWNFITDILGDNGKWLQSFFATDFKGLFK